MKILKTMRVLALVVACAAAGAVLSSETATMKKEKNAPVQLPADAIVVNLYYTGVDGAARKFAQEMEESGVADAIRKVDGNLRYEYYAPLDDPETVLLVDAWRDQESIDRHHASPAMGKIAALREKYDLHMRVERFKPDEEGTPERDKNFIRN